MSGKSDQVRQRIAQTLCDVADVALDADTLFADAVARPDAAGVLAQLTQAVITARQANCAAPLTHKPRHPVELAPSPTQSGDRLLMPFPSCAVSSDVEGRERTVDGHGIDAKGTRDVASDTAQTTRQLRVPR